jgi:hypothetical protein
MVSVVAEPTGGEQRSRNLTPHTYSRHVVGWSGPDHICPELVVDALS